MHLPVISAIGRRIGLGASREDAISLLKHDHREVDALFAAFEKARSSRDKQRLAKQICHALTVHAAIEEQIFYPAAREALDDDFLVDEAKIEHMHLKELVSEIDAMTPGEEMFDARMHVLSEYVRHHVREEEHEMFPRLRVSDMDMDKMGKMLMARREELIKRERANGHARANGRASAGGTQPRRASR